MSPDFDGNAPKIPDKYLNRLKQYVETALERGLSQGVHVTGFEPGEQMSTDEMLATLDNEYSWIVELLARRWKIPWRVIMRPHWNKQLAEHFNTPAALSAIWRYSTHTRQVSRKYDPNHKDEVLPESRFSQKYATFDDWLVWARRTMQPDRVQLMTIAHLTTPEANLETLRRRLQQTLQFHTLDQSYYDLLYRRDQNVDAPFSWEDWRRFLKRLFPLTPYWYLEKYQNRMIKPYVFHLWNSVIDQLRHVYRGGPAPLGWTRKPVWIGAFSKHFIMWLQLHHSSEFAQWVAEWNEENILPDWNVADTEKAPKLLDSLNRLKYPRGELIIKILHRMDHIWGGFKEADQFVIFGGRYYDDSKGFGGSWKEYEWLEKHYGITMEEDNQWLDVLYDFFGEEFATGDQEADESRRGWLASDEPETFLRHLEAKYCGNDAVYPCHDP